MQILPTEQIEHKLQEIVNRKERIMVSVVISGTIEVRVFGQLFMEFDKEDCCPFFYVQHPQQYAMEIRFYGQDVYNMKKTAETQICQIFLGNPTKNIDSLNDLP